MITNSIIKTVEYGFTIFTQLFEPWEFLQYNGVAIGKPVIILVGRVTPGCPLATCLAVVGVVRRVVRYLATEVLRYAGSKLFKYLSSTQLPSNVQQYYTIKIRNANCIVFVHIDKLRNQSLEHIKV